MADTAPNLMRVKIYAPFKTYYDDEAVSISAINKTGPFDVLAGHKNFMCLLLPCTVTVRPRQGEPFKLDISRGVMHVKSDQTTVFLDV